MKNTIKVERARHNISQTDLADAVGVSKQTILSIEKGRFTPSTILAMKIARYFKLKVEDVFELEEGD